MIYVKGIELSKEDDKVIIGVTEEEFTKSFLCYAISNLGNEELSEALTRLISGNKINLTVGTGKSKCSCGGNCGSSVKKNDIATEVVSNISLEEMKNSLVKKGSVRIPVSRMEKDCPSIYKMLSSKNGFNTSLVKDCDFKFNININSVTYSFIKDGGESISPSNNIVFQWDKVDSRLVSELYKLV